MRHSAVRRWALLAGATFGALPTLNALAAAAANPPSSRWYRIEVIVFERADATVAAARPKLLEAMRYPRLAAVLAPRSADTASAAGMPAFAPPPQVQETHTFFISNRLPPAWFIGECGAPIWQPAEAGATDPCLPELPSVDSEIRFPDDPFAAWPAEMPIPPAQALGEQEAVAANPRHEATEALAAALAEYESLMQETSYVWAPKPIALGKSLVRLRRHFNVLAAGTWHQALPPRDRPQPLLVQIGDADAARRFALEGWLAVTLGRYIHLEVRLQARLASGGLAVFAERRRMRSNELHYLDHPALGILAYASPVEMPANLQRLIAAVEGR